MTQSAQPPLEKGESACVTSYVLPVLLPVSAEKTRSEIRGSLYVLLEEAQGLRATVGLLQTDLKKRCAELNETERAIGVEVK
jgi:hypothetical protein